MATIDKYQVSKGRFWKKCLQSILCAVTRQFCTNFPSLLTRQQHTLLICKETALNGANAHQNQQRKSSSFGRVRRLSNTPLPVWLSMVVVHPRKSAIVLLAVSCYSLLNNLLKMAPCLCMNHTCILQILFLWMPGASMTVWYGTKSGVKIYIRLSLPTQQINTE